LELDGEDVRLPDGARSFAKIIDARKAKKRNKK